MLTEKYISNVIHNLGCVIIFITAPQNELVT